MNLQNTLEHCLFHYPDLYVNRTQVLFSVLTGTGTGYEWKRGQRTSGVKRTQDGGYPVSAKLFFKDQEETWKLDNSLALRMQNAGKRSTLPSPPPSKELVAEWWAKAEETVKDGSPERLLAKKRSMTPGPLVDVTNERVARMIKLMPRKMEEHMGYMSSGCPLLHIPDNVKADWLDACQEVAEYILEINGAVDRDEEEYAAVYDKRETENRRIAEAALARVQEIKNHRASLAANK